jgi:hypothetical protein
MNQPASQPIVLTEEARKLAASILTADSSAIDWTKVSALPCDPGNGQDTLLVQLRHILACGHAALRQRFLAGEITGQLITDRARLVDLVIANAWRGCTGADHAGCALVAVGGYGRGELHPCSDVDLLILMPAETAATVHDGLSVFLTLLWDAGIEIRHSVRNAQQCRQDAAQDLTVLTTLMESRLLLGPEKLLQGMRAAIAPENIWPSRDRFALHLLTGRREDRLLFDHQIASSPSLRLRGRLLHAGGRAADAALLPHGDGRQPAERTAAAAVPREAILEELEQRPAAAQRALPGAQRLPRGGQRRCVRALAARRCSSSFVLLQQHPEIRGVRASTIRAIGRHLWLIDEEFRQNPRNHRLFLRDPARARRRHARAAAHEHLRRAGPLHPLLRPHRRPHAVRPVPRLYGRRAHAVRGQQPAPARHVRASTTSCRTCRGSCSTLPRPRSPTSRRCSMTSPRAAAAITRTRRGRCRGLLPRAGPVAL